MKNYIIFFVLILAGLTACEDSLDFQVKDRIILDNFFLTENDAISSVTGIYDALIEKDMYKVNLWLIQDIASDDCDALSTWNDPNAHQLDRYTLQSTNNYITTTWRGAYLLISRANLSINRIPDIQMDEDLKSRLLGEAKYLRALSYFNLVRLFGAVPLILTTETDIDKYLVPRTSVDSVYAQIIKDLNSAAEKLPATYSGAADKGRATKGAALGLLSKVYLTQEDWEMAAAKALEVQELNIYGLWDDYAENFKEVNKNGKESLFEAQFYTGVQEENSRIVITCLPPIFAFPAGVGIVLPTEDLTSSFETGDHRYGTTFFEEYFYFGNNTFRPHIWKYWDQDVYPASETGQSGANFPLMRYSEILLIYAEALNELNSGPNQAAYDAANDVRIRARNGNDTVLPELTGLSYEDFQAAVWKEKRCETVNEGHRWFDLVRTGKLVENVKRAKGDKANPQAFNNVFPIPQRERDLNKLLEQNDQY